MTKATKQYKENYHGILCHDGWIRVAKSPITARITNIQGKNVRVKSYNAKKNSIVQYNCFIHKLLLKDLKFLAINDTVSVKWQLGKPYIVGYRKADAYDDVVTKTGDKPVSENMDWTDFFRGEIEC